MFWDIVNGHITKSFAKQGKFEQLNPKFQLLYDEEKLKCYCL